MSRIIINNKTDLKDTVVLLKVCEVINKGRLSNSNKQYAYLATFKDNGKEYYIVSDLRKKSDSFTIYIP